MARLWWFIRRPSSRGVMVALWHDDTLLCLQSSYRPLLTLPGGFVDKGESAQQAAQRELCEELHISLEIPATPVWHNTLYFESRQDQVSIFELQLPHALPYKIRRGEILWARYLTMEQIQGHLLMPHLQDYLHQRSNFLTQQRPT